MRCSGTLGFCLKRFWYTHFAFPVHWLLRPTSVSEYTAKTHCSHDQLEGLIVTDFQYIATISVHQSMLEAVIVQYYKTLEFDTTVLEIRLSWLSKRTPFSVKRGRQHNQYSEVPKRGKDKPHSSRRFGLHLPGTLVSRPMM